MGYYTRRHWTSTANRAVHVKRRQVHATLHYPGWGTDSIRTEGWSRERCFQQLRAWRNMHVGSGAYNEVAYNLYALPTGDVAEGRGNRQNAANGTSTANRAGMSIQVLIGDNEDLTMGHLRAIFDALALLERWHPGITARQYGHRHWVSTRCPGPKVQARIPYRPGTVPTDGGGKGITGTAPGLSDGLADVDDSQRWLTALGYDPGPIDGKFGARTQAATRQAQLDLGITPADGRPGPATRATLEAAVTTLDKISKDLAAIKRTLEPGIAGKRTDGELASFIRSQRNALRDDLRQISRTLEPGISGERTDGEAILAIRKFRNDIRADIAALRGEQAALEEALQEVAGGQGVDLDAVRAAAREGVAAALKDLEADVTLTLTTDEG